MSAAKKYLKFFTILEKKGKIVILCDKKVDMYEINVKKIEPNTAFDDPHLIAIILESKCKLICTNDQRASKYIFDKKFYSNGARRPALYTSEKNKDLLSDKYIANICKPCLKLTKLESNHFNSML